MRPTFVLGLEADRTQVGNAWLVDADREGRPVLDGPWFVRGLADRGMAASRDNPDRDPLKPFGNTPLGLWAITDVILDPDPGLEDQHDHSFGPVFLRLIPSDGDALVAARDGGRKGFGWHGGAPSKTGELRATYGCPRSFDEDIEEINAARIKWGAKYVEIVECD